MILFAAVIVRMSQLNSRYICVCDIEEVVIDIFSRWLIARWVLFASSLPLFSFAAYFASIMILLMLLLLLLGDITESNFAYWYRCYRFVVCLFFCLSVCLSRSCTALCSNGKRYRHDFYDSPMSLPDCAKIWLTSVDSFLPIFCPKLTNSLLIWASETFGGKLRLTD